MFTHLKISSFKLNQTDRQREIAILLALFLVGLLSRTLFASRILYHWDSVNFALAIEHFDTDRDGFHSQNLVPHWGQFSYNGSPSKIGRLHVIQ